MDDREIEKKLKDNADKISPNNYASRRTAVQELIKKEEGLAEEITVSESVPVTETNVGGNFRWNQSNIKKRVALLALLFVCIVTLAIVLPLVLKTKDEEAFFDVSELQDIFVSRTEFFNGIDESGIEIVDVSNYTVETYVLLVTPENAVKGGEVEFILEEKGYLVYMRFYDLSVTEVEEPEDSYHEYTVSGSIIKYETFQKEDVYNTVAITQYNKVNYYMEILSVEESVIDLFDELFGV